MALEIKNLTKKFGKQTALNNVSITIQNNEIVGLLGPNGAGKSTLMKSVVGALKVDDGQIFFNGLDILKNEIACKRQMGFLPENNPLYQEMYVREYLNFVGQIHHVSQQKIDEIIELTGIAPEKSKKIHQLSKGYKQRVGLAQAILHSPELLILDEPTNGLDPNQIIDIRNLIREIAKNKIVILSTHLMQEVEALCSRVILIHKGEIIQDSAIADFRGRYESLEAAFASYTNSRE